MKVVPVGEIAGNDWSLTPGRYVGVAPEEVDEDFDFEEALREIHVEIEDLNAEAARLAAEYQEELRGAGDMSRDSAPPAREIRPGSIRRGRED